MGGEECWVLAHPKVRENSPVPQQTSNPYAKALSNEEGAAALVSASWACGGCLIPPA